MENRDILTPSFLPFASVTSWLKLFLREKGKKMLCVKLKKLVSLSIIVFAVSSILFATNSFALFEDLTAHGASIFNGMREIIFAASGFGIVAVCLCGFFGTINWKWLTAIVISLLVIATTGALLNYMVDSNVSGNITDSLISAE